MTPDTACPECGGQLAERATLCAACGWDSTTAVTARPRPPMAPRLAALASRVVLYGLVALLILGGYRRLRTTGPGPDLKTTVRWMALGDNGRSAELVTLHRAFEIGAAASRFAVHNHEAPSFEGDWAAELDDYATMSVRGWIPLLFFAADAELAPPSVREPFTVSDRDGWGRAYRVATRAVPRSDDPRADPQVAADLSAGLRYSLFHWAVPDLEGADWLRLELLSAGADGAFDTVDDLRMVTYVQVGRTLRLSRTPAQLQRELEVAFTRGRHYFRFEGNSWDLIDARLLAEFRVESLV
jgi:hypothetical protein